MKIVFASHYALPHVGGIEGVVHHVATELIGRGHEVVHIASDARHDGRDPQGYPVVRVRAWNGPERRKGVPYPVFAPWSLRREVRQALRGADVVHAHGFLYMSTAFAFAAGPGPVRVLSEHVGHVAYPSAVIDSVERVAIATLGRACARMADVAVVHNDRVAEEMRALVPRVPVRYIANGVDTEFFRPAASDERERLRKELGWDERPRLIFVGRPVAKKGIDVVLAAGESLGEECEVVLVGSGEVEGDLPQNARSLGQQPAAEVARLLRAADVFLLPSRGEGFPLTVLEAMASGIPAVIADDPGYRSTLSGAGDAVRLVEPRSDAVTAAVRQLIDAPEARSAAGESAASFARAFSWARAAEEHERLYSELIEARASGSATT